MAERVARLIVAMLVIWAILCAVLIITIRILEFIQEIRRYRRMKAYQAEKKKQNYLYGLLSNSDVSNECGSKPLLTTCEECGKQYMYNLEKYTASEMECYYCKTMPRHCTQCGNELVWSVPYTRVEVESDDKSVLICKNVFHFRGWKHDAEDVIFNATEKALDDGERSSIKVSIEKTDKKEVHND